MKINLIYKGQYTGHGYRIPMNIKDKRALDNLRNKFLGTYPTVHGNSGFGDYNFRFDNFESGVFASGECVNNYDLFTEGNLTEIGKLEAFEVLENV